MKRWLMLLLLPWLLINSAWAEVIDIHLTVGKPEQILLLDERDGI